jgi:hypothetical protein
MNWAKGTGVLVECITTFSATPTPYRLLESSHDTKPCDFFDLVSVVSYFTAQFARRTRLKSLR